MQYRYVRCCQLQTKFSVFVAVAGQAFIKRKLAEYIGSNQGVIDGELALGCRLAHGGGAGFPRLAVAPAQE